MKPLVRLAQGFELFGTAEGLRIEVTDYHARSVTLPWALIRELVRSADREEADRAADHVEEEGPA